MNMKIITTIVGSAGVLLLLGTVVFLQSYFSEFIATRAPIDASEPAKVDEYTALCEQSCADFGGLEQQECYNNCIQLGKEYY